MTSYSLTHLTNPGLLQHVTEVLSRDRATTAELLAGLAEVDARRLYVPAAYPSIHAWCVGVLRMSKDAAFRRIRAARTARQFPALFPMLADGRLDLSGVLSLAPHLTPENADDLLAAAADQTHEQLARLLAERFPKPDQPSAIRPLAACGDALAMSPGRSAVGPTGDIASSGDVNPLAAAVVEPSTSRARLAPIARGRYELQMTLGQETHDLLRYAQDLLGNAVPAGDLAEVMHRGLELLVEALEKQRFAATSRPRPSGKCHKEGSRHVPAEVRRLVWERDGGQCTFVSDSGHRCEARSNLEFDHVEAFARGGANSLGNLRLRCRAHNQFEAERTYGADFMQHQRAEAKRRTEAAREAKRAAAAQAAQAREAAKLAERERAAAEARAREAERAAERERQAALQARRDELVPFLRQLGYSLAESRLASTVCDTMPDATLEDRLRAALKRLMPSGVRIERPCARGAA